MSTASRPERRRSDGSPWRRLIRANAYRDAWLLIISGLLVWAVLGIADLVRTQRDGQCEVFERLEVAAIAKVQAQYAYLEQLPREEYGSNLTKAIVRGLPGIYKDAEASISPAYCNEKGIGLPEVAPFVPALPERRDFSDLARRPAHR